MGPFPLILVGYIYVDSTSIFLTFHACGTITTLLYIALAIRSLVKYNWSTGFKFSRCHTCPRNTKSLLEAELSL